MKKIILCALMPLFTVAWGQSNEDSQNKEDSFEQLKKEFEEIRHKPSSPEHFTWFARCAKNEECRKSAKKNFEKIPKEELTDMMIDSMAFTGEYCRVVQESEEEIKSFVKKSAQDIENINKFKKFVRGYHFVVGGLLTSGGALCILNNENILVNMFGTVSVAAGLFSFLRFFIE